MSKKATTIAEQLDLLKSRGMIIEDTAKAEEYLLDIGYYRLGLYWYYFQKDFEKHTFKEGTKLDIIIKLYYLDVDLRNLLSKYLYRIEVNFRTKIVYKISNAYEDSPTWFIDPKIMSSNFINNLGNFYNDNFKKYNIPINKHHNKYINDRYAPAWKTLEFFTFGQINYLFKNLLNNDLKVEIAKNYDIRNLKVFENHIRSMINIRNICSHSSVLFDYHQPKGIRKIPDPYYRAKGRDVTSLNISLRLILFYLSKISVNRAKELEKDLIKLFTEAFENIEIKNIIENQTELDLLD